MSIETIVIESEDQWLQQRTQDITSTEVSALFGLSPYKTEFELYHEKSNGQAVKIPDNTRMKWGRRFEAPIAQGVAEDQGWNIAKINVYMRDAAARIGSSFDYKIESSSDGPGLLEIKNVDTLQFRKNWLDDEAPEHIELQIQHQMEVSGIKWCALVAMVGGNDPKVILRNYDSDIGRSIRAKVAAFWETVDSGRAPSADYTRDADLVARLHSRSNAGEILDTTNDVEFERLVLEYQTLSVQIDELDAQRKAHKAQLLERIGAAEKVIGPWGSIAAGQVKASQGRLITAEMVGTYQGARSGYRNFKLNMKKEI